MKRVSIIAAVMAISLSGLTAQAGFFISWGPGGSSFGGDAFAPLLQPGQNALVQLMYSDLNADVDSTVFNTALNDDLSTDGDDIVLASFNHVNTGPGDGTDFGIWTTQIFGNNPQFAPSPPETPFLGPNVYVRMFLGDGSVGDQYFTSMMQTATDVQALGVGVQVPETIVFFPAGFQNVTGDLRTVALIPEPTSIAMILFGAMTIFIRHRRRR